MHQWKTCDYDIDGAIMGWLGRELHALHGLTSVCKEVLVKPLHNSNNCKIHHPASRIKTEYNINT